MKKCEFCGKSFKSNAGMTNHIRSNKQFEAAYLERFIKFKATKIIEGDPHAFVGFILAREILKFCPHLMSSRIPSLKEFVEYNFV